MYESPEIKKINEEVPKEKKLREALSRLEKIEDIYAGFATQDDAMKLEIREENKKEILSWIQKEINEFEEQSEAYGFAFLVEYELQRICKFLAHKAEVLPLVVEDINKITEINHDKGYFEDVGHGDYIQHSTVDFMGIPVSFSANNDGCYFGFDDTSQVVEGGEKFLEKYIFKKKKS